MTDKTIEVWVAVDPNGEISPHLACSIDNEIAARIALGVKLHGDAWVWNAIKNKGWKIVPATLTIRIER